VRRDQGEYLTFVRRSGHSSLDHDIGGGHSLGWQLRHPKQSCAESPSKQVTPFHCPISPLNYPSTVSDGLEEDVVTPTQRSRNEFVRTKLQQATPTSVQLPLSADF
jgi:hypothetical protein